MRRIIPALITAALLGVSTYALDKTPDRKVAAPESQNLSEGVNFSQLSYTEKLRLAKEITVDEQVISLGKKYDLMIKGEKVGEVTGKAFAIWGDEFTLKTLDGKVLASEKEKLRFFSFNHAATVYDENGKISGYLAEDKWQDFFKWGYIFHIFDGDGKEIGTSDKFSNSCLGSHRIYNKKGGVDYDIDKKFSFFGDEYEILVSNQRSKIPVEHTILMTCIEDAIGDAHEGSDSDDSDNDSNSDSDSSD